MNRIKINCFGKTVTGPVRPNNEDTFLVKPEMGFCLVADGMGGYAAGELASRIFAETALEVFSKSNDQSHNKTLENVQKTFRLANERILKHVEENPHHHGMGCTAEFIAFHEQDFVLGHIGDSRTYRNRNSQLNQLTKDHSLVQDQIDYGLISPEEARNHSMRNVIFRAVGVKDTFALDISKGKTISGDLFLLCSDGLTDMVDDSQISHVLSSAKDLPNMTEELIEIAIAAGGKDNITVVLIEIL
jgi:serine/threonine protein phosphatase PrpC